MADEGACAICLERLGVSEESCSSTSCGHIFHGGCIARCMQDRRQCPVCRTWDITVTRLFHNFREDDTRVNRSVVNMLEAQVQRQREEYDLLAGQHQLQVTSLLHDAEHLRRQAVANDQELQELRRLNDARIEQLEELQRLRASNTTLQQQLDSTTHEVEAISSTYSEVFARECNRAPDMFKVTIRNLTADMVVEPQAALRRILRLLRLRTPRERYILESSSMMVSKPGLHQLQINCQETKAKVELLAKFSVLQQNSNESLRQLQIKDIRAVQMFYKWANQFIKARRGIQASRQQAGQVLVMLAHETTWRELEDEAQVHAIVAELEQWQAARTQ